jgi:AbrB family transcriptional regulator, transcriptional pleiotropic regulator of transition state genes
MARKVDDLGRIVLPVELRRLHGIQTGDALEISVDGDSIVLRKLSQGCVFCGTSDGLSSYRSRSICTGCRDGLTDPVATPEPVASAH